MTCLYLKVPGNFMYLIFLDRFWLVHYYYYYYYYYLCLGVRESISMYIYISKVKLATVVEVDQKAPFSLATTRGVGEGAIPFPGLLHFTLNTYLILLSVKQGGIKYHFLSLWYDSSWDWTPVSWAIGEHSTHSANDIYIYIYIYINIYYVGVFGQDFFINTYLTK